MKGYLRAFINIIYPLKCQICRVMIPEGEVSLCPDCRNKIRKTESPFCIKCGNSLPAPAEEPVHLCGGCRKINFYFQRAWSATFYEGIIKECIHLIKFKKRVSLIKPLTKLLIEFSKSFLDISRFDLLIPVPLDRNKKWEREFNQSSLLMEALAKEFRVPGSRNNLVKIRSTPAQSSLPRQQRPINVNGVFKVRRPQEITDKTILLIDDVFTTGATSSECAKVLSVHQAKHIEVLTLARSV